MNKFREGDDPQENAYLKDSDKFEEVESNLTFVGICGIKVSYISYTGIIYHTVVTDTYHIVWF